MDDGLQYLLELDGERFLMGGGFWTKFDIRRVTPSAEIPHGIRYSLTLHDRKGRRLLGFDNAHGLKAPRKFQARRVEWDHRHDADRVEPYMFCSADKLLEDFWHAVERILEQE